MWTRRLTPTPATKSVKLLARRRIYFVATRPEKVNGSDETDGIFRLREIFHQDVPRMSMTVAVKTEYFMGKNCAAKFALYLSTTL